MKRIINIFLNQSLKKKWTFSTTIVIFLSYSAICLLIFFALYTWLFNNEEVNAIRTTDELTDFFRSQEGSITIQDFQKNSSLVRAIINQNQTVRIYNVDGYEVIRINDEYPAVPLELSIEQRLNTIVMKETIGKNDVIVIQRPVQIGVFTGYMQLIHPLESFQSLMKYVLTAMLIAGLGALLIAISISNYLANILLKPLQDLRDSMTSVREKGFEQDITFDYKVDDEIGDLLKIYRSMMEELQQSFSKQQQFVSDASHELRTPIQAIEGHLSLIKRWGKDDPEVFDESLKISLNEVQRMKKMIEELLNLVREEEPDRYSTANIKKVIKAIKEELQIIQKNVTIMVSTIGEEKYPHISENALAQIIRNIVENGIRYNDNQPVIDIQINYLSENIFMTIKDNGIGIGQQHLPHIFDRFYRVDESRENVGNGTGLGLSITRMLANKYNVEIDVTSTVGEGTIFTLRFPLI